MNRPVADSMAASTSTRGPIKHPGQMIGGDDLVAQPITQKSVRTTNCLDVSSEAEDTKGSETGHLLRENAKHQSPGITPVENSI